MDNYEQIAGSIKKIAKGNDREMDDGQTPLQMLLEIEKTVIDNLRYYRIEQNKDQAGVKKIVVELTTASRKANTDMRIAKAEKEMREAAAKKQEERNKR